MNKDVIELYDNFNAKGYPDRILFGDFHDQPTPLGYYYLLIDNNVYENNNPGTPVDNVFPYKK